MHWKTKSRVMFFFFLNNLTPSDLEENVSVTWHGVYTEDGVE